MQQKLLPAAEPYTRRNRRRSIWRRIVSGLACAVVFCTAYALMLPAITMENTPICETDSHIHTEDCYIRQTTTSLICTPETLGVHIHAEECLDPEGNLLCGLADFMIHVHDEVCLTFGCTLPEIPEHIHQEDCYALHVHDETCYDTESGDLLCGQEETAVLLCELPEMELHSHTEECFTDGCTQPEILAHIHDDSCFLTEETEPELDCMLEEHVHEDACYPEPAAVFALISAVTADSRTDDLPAVAGDGIEFRLFNYSTEINKTNGAAWRPISDYFTFRNSNIAVGADPGTYIIPSHNINAAHDEDGFTIRHATVERVLDANGNPVLDLTRNADGTLRTDPGLSASERSLAYLFSDTGDHAVTAYDPSNTILQKSGTHYWYNSRENAVDYDLTSNVFRVRSYAERNSTTAGYAGYGDFLPFTYTDGQVIGTHADTAVDYHVETAGTDYWFGMTMEVQFFQTKDGVIDDENMVFNFSGDDDVWVFVDDVLVLDLGGTHGTVDGSINFATGEVLQYLSWSGANSTDAAKNDGSSTSFPTTIRACFDAAGKTPNGGWSEDGSTFAAYTEHTLKFFYLERGAAVANCLIDFRLPTLPDKSLTVTKDLVYGSSDNLTDYLEDTLSYQFRVVKADASGAATDELFLTAGMTYDLLEGGVKTGTGTVNADGSFFLKAGQSAQFTEMLEKGNGAIQYIVEEIMPDGLTGQYAGVEYEVSGAGGDTITGEGPAQDFTAYQTASLSAEETQTVTYRNQIDTSKLSSLQITKQMADGASLDPDAVFQIQVKLGGQLLPVGTPYTAGGETKTVSTAGIIQLKRSETAELLQGILSGTSYEITEIGTAEGGYNASYSGTVTPEGQVSCTANGASGTFPLGSTVHVTVTNANYDFAAEIPIRKQAIDLTGTETFVFHVEQVVQTEDGWVTQQELPGGTVTVSNDVPSEDRIVIGFDAETSGTFYYKIYEQPGNDAFIYDETFYIAEVTVGNGTASVTRVLKNGVEAVPAPLEFVNRKTTSLMVRKTVLGTANAGRFRFTAAVTLDGAPFALPPAAENADYTVNGNEVSFSLGHGETITIPNIPYHAQVTVTETAHHGYITYHQVVGADPEKIHGDSVTVSFEEGIKTVNFTNQTTYVLPDTGGAGTGSYTIAGLMLLSSAACLLLYRRRIRPS